jgi:hypothetical protein
MVKDRQEWRKIIERQGIEHTTQLEKTGTKGEEEYK